MRLGRSILRLVLLLLLVACAKSASAQIGRVNGVVKDEAGQPMKGVTITADNPNIGQSFTATTDDKGRFTILGLRAGQWRFISQFPGYAPEAGAMPVRMGSPNPPITFVMRKTGVAQFGALGGITNRDIQEDLSAGDALFQQQRWDAAVEAYRRALGRSPALAVVNLQIGAAYRGKKDYDAALGAYNALLAVNPDHGKALLGVSATHLERGDRRAAEDVLIAAAGRENVDREVLYALGELKIESDADEAARWYAKAAAADPIWGKPRYKLGLHAIKKGNNSDATKLLTEAMTVDPTSPEAALAKSSLELLNK